MRLYKGKADYHIPEIGQLLAVVFDPCEREMKGIRTKLMIVPHSKLHEMKSKGESAGSPKVAALTYDRISIWPAPDKNGTMLEIHYYPPIKVY